MDDTVFWRAAKFYRLFSGAPVTRRLVARRFEALCKRTRPTPVVESLLAGMPVALDLSIASDRTIYLQGACDPRGVGALQRVMKRLAPRTAWDVGANRGNHAAFMRPLCRRLFCFEPNPAEVLRLKALFAQSPEVTVLDIGLSDEAATRPFLIVDRDSGNSTFEVDADQANARQDVQSGDEIASRHDIDDLDFVKIDVEGHETSVLRGMAHTIGRSRPVIIFEILQAQSRRDSGFEILLPRYTLYGNRIGVRSAMTRSPYTFCKFVYDRTYMCALAVPNEKIPLLSGLLPR